MTEVSSGCLEWTGRRDDDGYGVKWHRGKNWRVSRLTWTQAHGPIPPGMMILHRCDNPPCYSLNHLYAGDAVDNMRDKVERGRDHRRNLTHCKNGHEFTEANTYRRPDRPYARGCRECKKIRQREYKKRLHDESVTESGGMQ